MRRAWIALLVSLLGCGCATALSRTFDREGVYQVGEPIDVASQRDRLTRDFTRSEAILANYVQSLERSSDIGRRRVLEVMRQRLIDMKAVHRVHLQMWDEFAAKLSSEDTVIYVKKRTSADRYYVALRESRIVARSGIEELYGSIE